MGIGKWIPWQKFKKGSQNGLVKSEKVLEAGRKDTLISLSNKMIIVLPPICIFGSWITFLSKSLFSSISAFHCNGNK